MSLFSSLRDFAQSLAKDADTVFQQVTTHSQLERIAAAAVLIAYADVAQGCLGEDSAGNVERNRHDNGAQRIRQQVAHGDVSAFAAHGARGGNKVALLQR